MNRRSARPKIVAEINITPLTDVALTLLIIFMITTPLILQSSIKVNLPEAASGRPLASTRQINITVSGDNSVYIDDKLVTRKELISKVKILHRDNPELEVLLFSDKTVRFKNIVSILDDLNEIGIKNLNIAAKVEQ
ncbi:MAG: biopolymer transporter ExbD [Candidatus Omnitrophota bacterium]|nr:biopolymer transporter ExbD [Candidatus Omnitrophota bacterium]